MGAAEADARGAHATVAALSAQPRNLGKLRMGESPFIEAGPLAWIDKEHVASAGPARPRARHPPPDWGGGDRAGGGPPDAGPALAHGRAGRDADAAVRPEQPPVRAEPDQRRARGQRGLLALHRARAGPGPAHHAPAALRAAEVLAWRVDCPPGPPRAILYRGHSTEVNLAARARTP